jgi:single-stranded-DNA-specific exonuclease
LDELNLSNNKPHSSRFSKNVHVYSHLDADGLCAASIMAYTLKRANIGFQITIIRQLEISHIESIKKEIELYNHFIILTDFGTGQLEILKKNLKINDYLIIDHHKPEKPDEVAAINHINPYYHGISGSSEISGAGTCYFFAKVMDQENIDLSWIGIVGALGDLQNKGEKGAFTGVNEIILKDAVENGRIRTELNLAVSRNRPISNAIAYTLPEFVPGISNDEAFTQAFLESHDIRTTNELNEPRTLMDLTDNEVKSLSKELLKYALIEHDVPMSFSHKLITTFYILTDYNNNKQLSDAREMSSLLNSCGRNDNPSLGISLLMGEKGALETALRKNVEYRKKIHQAHREAREHIRDLSHIKVMYGGEKTDEKIIGTIASMVLHSDLGIEKPVIAYADSDSDTFKISARAQLSLTKKGLDLGVVMRTICKDLLIENPAGGHPPAAGAKIPRSKLKEFLELVNKLVEKQLKMGSEKKV